MHERLRAYGLLLREHRVNAAHVVRDMTARHDALANYARWFDEFSETEQVYQHEDRVYEAEGAHQFAVRLLRAYRAELDDPEVAA